MERTFVFRVQKARSPSEESVAAPTEAKRRGEICGFLCYSVRNRFKASRPPGLLPSIRTAASKACLAP
jgi:hypothetical protein